MSEEDIEWTQNPWPGMLLRIVTRDLSSWKEETTFKKVPPERDLAVAMDWAAKEFFDSTLPATRPWPEPKLATPPRKR